MAIRDKEDWKKNRSAARNRKKNLKKRKKQISNSPGPSHKPYDDKLSFLGCE